MKNLQLFCLLLKSKRSAFSAQAKTWTSLTTSSTDNWKVFYSTKTNITTGIDSDNLCPPLQYTWMVGATGTGIKAGLNDATFQPCFLTGTFGNVPLQDVIVRVQYKHQGVAWDDSLGYFDNSDGTGQFRNKDDHDVDVGTGGMSPIVRSSCALKHTCSVCPQGDHIAVNTTSDCEACPAISTNPGGAPSRRFLMGANTLKFYQEMGDEKDECDVTNVVETFEKATYGFYFDGTSTCLKNVHSNAGASNKLTLSFWMRGPYTEGRSTTFLNLGGAGAGGTQDAFRLALDDQRRVYVSSELDNGQQWAVSASVPLAAGDSDSGIYPWQHVVLAVDTTQAVASNRVKWYIDGVRQTPSTTGLTYPSLNFASSPYQTANTRNWIGCGDGSGNPYNHFKGWLAQIVRVDGQALGPKIFRADNGNMRLGTRDFPRNFSGTEILMKSMDESLVLGNNGFMVTFDDVNEPGRDYSGTTGKQYTTLGATGAAGHVLDGPRLNVPTYSYVNGCANEGDHDRSGRWGRSCMHFSQCLPAGCFDKKVPSTKPVPLPPCIDGCTWTELSSSAYCNHSPPGVHNSGTQSIVLDNSGAASIAACKQQCEETPNCNFITSDHSGGDCRTYQTCTGTPRLYPHSSYESHELTRG